MMTPLLISLLLIIGLSSADVSIDGNDVVSAYVTENSDVGTTLVDFHATETNGGQISWSLNDTGQFSISSSGVVKVAGSIDREALPSPHVIPVTVTASSGNASASVLLSVFVQDENDNAPVFENTNTNSDTLTLTEDESVNTVIYSIVASDPDYGAGGNYHFVLSNPDGYFSVGYFTGDIELVKSLDHDTNDEHTITVHIQDEGTPQYTTVVTITVTVEDTVDPGPSPAQKFYYASLIEGTYTSNAPPSLATVSATAGSSGNIVKYSIINNGQSWIDQFSVGSTSGVVSVVGTLDREAQSRYVVGIRVTEYLSNGVTQADAPNASTTLVLTVTDDNDNTPQFYSGSYTGFVDENAEEGHIVIASVSAFDLDVGSNGEFTYQILGRQSGYEFQINPLTAVINVTGDLDYESGDIKYTFIIIAAESSSLSNPKTGSATVTIYVRDINDHAPMLSGNQFEYVLTENVLKSFTPKISASDGDSSSSFNTLSFEINGIGTESPYDHFQITEEPKNTVQLSNKVALDKESIDFYHMIITVKDNGPSPFSSTADIYVNVTDLNDFPPAFDESSYSVNINEETTYTTCVKVFAEDTGDTDSVNTGITYSLSVSSSSPNTSLAYLQDKFSINSVTGVITCEPIDHESKYHTIILTVVATDSGTNPGPLTDTATVTVTVENLNEHPPVFNSGSYSATIKENLTVGEEIGVTVEATQSGSDSDDHVITYSIVGGNTNGAFLIDEDSGVMTLASQLGINYEQLTPNPIVVQVEALDTVDSEGTKYSATTTVEVTVTDVNEFAPVITAPLGNPTFSVSEAESSLPKTITTITATDADGTKNVPTYSLVAPANGTFEVGSSTGILTMTSPPDRESIAGDDDTFTITLIAKDQASIPKSSSTTITIKVTDANDHAPVFDQTMFNPDPIPEDTGGAVSILTIHAEDNNDIGSNAEITYKINSVSPLKAGVVKFQLDSTTGVLQTGPAGFDYEDPTDRMYTIVMIAEDGGSPTQTDTATATITITNVNDNPPNLCENFLEYKMDEFYGATLSSSDTVLTNLSCVTDVDSTEFKYRIVDASKTNGWFDVDPDDGSIYIPSGTNIDREHSDTIVDSFGRAIFTFEVEVTDSDFSNGDIFKDEAEITVYIYDINDNSPQFSETTIDRTLPEGVPIGTIVDIVSATDNDYKTNAVIKYSETSGDEDGLFSVSSNGRITTAAEIDKEMIDSAITFVITATDNGGLNDTITVKVTITDTNDNSPIFSPTFYQRSIPENIEADALVEVVNATDADPGINGKITYEIIGGNIGNAFKMTDSLKGDIQVSSDNVIDRETLSFYRLVVIARDGATGSFQRTAVAEVAITITDINDNVPEFLHMVHKATVPEDIANNTFVSVSPSIYATDKDTGVNADILYDIQSGFPFTINKDTGFVYTSYVSVLDRENIDFYNITVYARDTGGFETSGILLITISDVNDHAPIIDQTPQQLDTTISEYYQSGGLIGKVTATDKDIGVNSVLRFSLTGGEGYFQVDPNYGNVTLSQTIKNLERRTPFSVTVTVTDGGLPAKQDQVTFDVEVTDENDNAPVFKHDPLEYSYPEDTDISSPLLLPVDPALTANGVVEDADEGINQEYVFLLDTSSSPAFDLNSDTGSLYFTYPLDYENQTSYSGTIYVQDKGSPALTSENKITITLTVTDVNDLPPVFDVNVFSTNVSEYTNANVPILLVTAKDGDTLDENKVTSFSLTGSSPASGLDLFKINSDTGLLLTKTFLEDSTKGCYDLSMEVRNPGTQLKDDAEARICITDQNESPDFDQSFYNFTIYENEAAGYELGIIQASDPDSDPNFVSLSYTLVTTLEDEGLFTINKTTGLLTTLVPLDREDSDLHILTVIVQDQGNDNFQHTNYTTILVNVLDVNDNSPQLVHSTFNSEYTISENISRNSTIANIRATDVDLSTINNFRIVDDKRTLFKIDHQSGVLQTEGGPEDFDRESFTNYTITFEVYNVDDQSKFDQASITFFLTDVNDNTPYFTVIPNDTCIYENSPNGLSLGTFAAGDEDIGVNSRVFYQITEGNTKQAFTIEALTGKLKTQNPLDYEQDPLEYTLTIEVQDLGIPPLSASAKVTICVMDTNDNPPMFTNLVTGPVVIKEHTSKGHFIANFTTVDIDSYPFNQTQISLISGNDKGAFHFDPTTNTLYVEDPAVLDYEENTLIYTLTVEATDVDDTTKTDTASVTVVITDINDHPPYFDKTYFNLTLLESETTPTILGQVDASDVDTATLTYQLVEGNEDGKFNLDELTGILSLVGQLDYETPPNYYSLTVNVTDGDFYDQAFFHIYVDNVNDVHPVITKPSSLTYLITIAEDKQPGLELYVMEAFDEEGGALVYEFSNGQLEYGVVRLNSSTGVITLNSELDYETHQSYQFDVVVKDDGIPPLQDSAHFQIEVTDVDDHLPDFTISSQTLQLYENHSISADHFFFTVYGRDVDTSDTFAGNFFFYIVLDGGLLSDIECGPVFCVTKETGRVYHNRYLDRETVDSYVLTLAISNYPSSSDSQALDLQKLELKIDVLDNNDNAPYFTSFTNLIGVRDDAAYGSIVFTCKTDDLDTFENYDKVWYRFLKYGIPFTLDRESCIVQTATTLNERSGEVFVLRIEAYDNEGKNPSHSTDRDFKIYVYNYRDNVVKFTLNITIEEAINNLNSITMQLTNITGDQIIITDITYTVLDNGEVDTSRVDIVFIAVGGEDQIQSNEDILPKLGINITIVENSTTSTIGVMPTIPPRLVDNSGESIPLWVIIVIIVILGAIILILCCTLCAFLIVEKRRKEKYKEKNLHTSLSSDFSAISSKEYSATKNPLYLSSVIVPPTVEVDSLSSMNASIERPNPVYEEQEITIDMFDGLSNDNFSMNSREELLPPPLSTSSLNTVDSKENLLKPKSKPSPKALPAPKRFKDPPSSASNRLFSMAPEPVAIEEEERISPPLPPTDLPPVSLIVDEDYEQNPLPETVPNEPSVTKTVRSKVDDDKPTPRKEQQLPKPVYHGQELVMEMFEDFDDEDPPSSSSSFEEDLLEKAIRLQ